MFKDFSYFASCVFQYEKQQLLTKNILGKGGNVASCWIDT